MRHDQVNLKCKHKVRSKGEQGFSLLELVVSMMLFMIVTGAVWGVLRAAQMSRSVVNQQVDLQKNVRLGLNLIGRDTYNAGFGYPLRNTVVLPDNRISTLLAIPVDTDSTRDTVPPIIAGNNITLNTFNTAANIRTDQVTFLFKDSTFNLVGTGAAAVSQPLSINAATTNGSGIDEIVPISGSNTLCRVNDIYLITGNSGSTLGVATAMSGTNIVQFSNGDVLAINQTGSTGPLRSITVPASIQRVLMVTYYVAADGTLTRREYANATTGSYIDEPLVYNVEDFQIKYVMDNGTLLDNPSAGPDGIAGTADDTQSNLAAVRQIRVTISVRSVEKNSSNQPYRQTMTATFSTRNLGYDAS
ncbi:MAG: PilW family protein [Chloracidobacterium sp.]|nr:PilW family protein [Chloracidobacterium sp.]